MMQIFSTVSTIPKLFIGLFGILFSVSVFAVPTGEISHPIGTQRGNIIILAEVSDPDGLDSVGIEFSNGRTINICSSNCGTSQRYFRTGVSPREFGLSPGSVIMNLWVGDTSNVIDSHSFTWNPATVENVTTSRVIGSINVSWNAVSGALRYNVYVASQQGLTPGNAESLSHGQAFRSLTGTSHTITPLPEDASTFDTTGMFILVSAVNASGESAFSSIVRVAALDNQDPITSNDFVTVDEDSSVSGNVLENDSDPEGADLTAELLTGQGQGPLNGTVALSEDGNFTYEPNSNYFGSDSFQYLANDPLGGSGIGTVEITVRGINDSPTANDDSYQVNEDTPLDISSQAGLLNNDSDPDGDNLSIVSASALMAQNGALSVGEDGAFNYIPNENFFGVEEIAYTVTDNSGTTDNAFLRITVLEVNDLPVAQDDAFSILSSETLIANVTENDSDIDGDSLQANLVSDVSNGSLTLSPSGNFSYTADPEFNGNDQFSYSVSDGQATSNVATVTIEVIFENNAPLAADDAYLGTEDEPLSIAASEGLLANDVDNDAGDILTAVPTPVSGPQFGTVNISGDGAFTYQPDENFFGIDSFVYLVEDRLGESSRATVNIEIAAVNDEPVANDDEFGTLESVPVSGNVLENDEDADGDALVAEITTSTEHGILALESNGNFTYTPDQDFEGEDQFSYSVSDGNGGAANATAIIVVVGENDPPVANDDSYEGIEDEILSISAESGLLANDEDTDLEDQIRVVTTPTSAPTFGSLVLRSDGSFDYQPDENFFGEDSFSYAIRDRVGETSEASVSILIAPVNDAPVTEDDEFTTLEDVEISGNVLENDTDPDDDTLSVSLIQDVENGELTLTESGDFTYIPNEAFNGNDQFIYNATDNNGGNTSGTVNIIIVSENDDPVANDDVYEGIEDQSLNIRAEDGLLANDTDADLDDRLKVKTIPVEAPASGELTLLEDGSFSYIPEEDFFGEITFIYEIQDRLRVTSQAQVTLIIEGVNDLPVANDDAYEMDEDTILVADGEDIPGVLDNDSDADAIEGDLANEVTVSLLTDVSHGALNLSTDGVFAYQPDENYDGTDQFSYQLTDAAGETATAEVVITIINTNEAPVAVDDAYDVNEDELLEVSAEDGVLSNDTDADADELTILEELETAPQFGELQLNSDGSFSYQPNENFFGEDSFVYQVADTDNEIALGTVSISVIAVNDAPIAAADSYSTLEDIVLIVDDPTQGLLANDSDVDITEETNVEELTVSLVSELANAELSLNPDGTFTLIPADNFQGFISFTYQVTDSGGLSDEAEVIITVEGSPDDPVAEPDAYSVQEDTTLVVSSSEGVLSNDSDPDGTELSVSGVLESPTLGTVSLNTDGSFTYSPFENENGTDSFSYEIVNEAGSDDVAQVTITIEPVNDTPTAENDTAETNENQTIQISPLDNDQDVDGDTLTIVSAQAELGTASIANDGATISYTAPGSGGTDTVSYTISDPEGATASAVITITINDVNDAPVAQDDTVTINEDQSISINVLANDSDADNDSLTIVDATASSGIALIVSGISISYTPEENFNGSASISYTIEDPSGASDSATVDININPVNDLPVAIDDNFTTTEDIPITIKPLSNDKDVDNDPLIISGFTHSDGSVSQTDSQTLVYTPSFNFFGTAAIDYVVSDQNGGTASATITVAVTEQNNLPVANSDSDAVFAGESIDISPLVNDTDGDNETLTITTVTADVGSVAISSDATSLTYSAPSDTTTTATINYTITDTRGATASSTISVAVTEQPLEGNFDPDGDGQSDVSAVASGGDFVVTFGEDVDSVYFEEDGETVAVTANDVGVYEITIESATSPRPDNKDIIIRDNKNAYQGMKGVWAAEDFVLSGATSVQIFYSQNGNEYSFKVTKLDQTSPNIAFGKPQPLATDFAGETELDFYTRAPAFTGPFNLGINGFSHYGLQTGGTGFYSGSFTTGEISWQIVDGAIEVNFINTLETEIPTISVYELDDDNSDGVALNVITKAEADAYVAANNTEFVNAYVSDAQHIIRKVRDAKVFIVAEIEEFVAYRIDSSQHPEITSAQSPVIASGSSFFNWELLDIEKLKIHQIAASDLTSSDIVLDIPTVDHTSNEFARFSHDLCSFSETSAGSNSGSGSCEHFGNTFTWSISGRILELIFDNGMQAEYRWLDKLAVANSFVIDAEQTINSELHTFATMSMWIKDLQPTDAAISTFISGNYFDNGFNKTNPDAVDDNGNVLTEKTFGFYFDASSLSKRILGNVDLDDEIYLADEDWVWDVSNGEVKIAALSNLSSNVPFRYQYAQCTDSADAQCFAWRVREWIPMAIQGDRIWVLESSQIHTEGASLSGAINYIDFIPPRLQFYQLDSDIPGQPNSISFNQEPQFQGSLLFTTDVDTPISNIDLITNSSDPESDTLTAIKGVSANGTIVVNSDQTFTYTPNSGFIGTDFVDFVVSDGVNQTRYFTQIIVLGPNTAPVATDDTVNTFKNLTTRLDVLENDTDIDGDILQIDSATVDSGTVTVVDSSSNIEFQPVANATGTATVNYQISDGRGGIDTATVTITIAEADLIGSYDLNGSGTDDFTIVQDTGNSNLYTVTFGEEVDSLTYTIDGKTFIVSPGENGGFEFTFDSTDSTQPVLTYVIDGVTFSFTPENINSASPTILFSDVDDLANDFGTEIEYLLLSRHASPNSAFATEFVNGKLYDLTSSGTGTVTGPHFSDSVTWAVSGGEITVTYDNPFETIEFWDIYSLDDEDNGDGALGVITKAEADAYFAANNTDVVDVFVSVTSETLMGRENNGYFYITDIESTKSYRISSTEHPEITSANAGVPVQGGFEERDLLDLSRFDFHPFSGTDDLVGQTFLPVARSNGSGHFKGFAADECSFSETTTGSNDGSGSCIHSGLSFSWSILTDGELQMVLSNGITTSLQWLNHSDIENTVFVAATDSNTDTYSTLDYWFRSNAITIPQMQSLLEGNYLANSDILTNPFNFDGSGNLNSDIVDGFYFDASGKAKELNGFFQFDNTFYIEDKDHFWEVSSATSTKITARSNLSSSDTFTYDYSLCSLTPPGDQDCFEWSVIDWTPLAIANNRVYVLETEQENDGGPFWDGSLDYVEDDFPRIVFYEVASEIPGTPNSINFNQAPHVVGGNNTTPIDTALTIDLLATASDPESDTLTLESAAATSGEVVIHGNGTVTFTPDTGFIGQSFIDYVISDGVNEVTAIYQISVLSAGNNPPIANDSFFTLANGQTHSLDPVTGSDSDPDSDPLTITTAVASLGTASVTTSTTISYTAPAAPIAADVIHYTISDGNGGIATAFIHITLSANSEPTANNDTFSVAVNQSTTLTPLANDSDPDSDPLTITAASVTSGVGSVSIDSGDTSLTYSSSSTGSATISYTISDGNGGTDTGLITVTVTSSNSAPVANDDTVSVEVNQSETLTPLTNDTDPDGDSLTITAATVTSGVGSVSIASGDTTLTYSSSSTGSETISYTIVDGNGGTDSATISVTVVNDFPAASNDSYTLLHSGSSVNVSANAGVLINDSDPNGDTISAALVTGPTNSTAFTLNADGSFSYQHNGTGNLTDSFTYNASDGTNTASATVSLTIAPDNNAPQICTIPQVYAQVGEPFVQDIVTKDHDEEPQTITLSGEPSWMTISTIDSTSSQLSGTPGSGDVGTFTGITVETTDGFDTETLVFDLTVVDDFGSSNSLNVELGGTLEQVTDVAIDNYGNIVIVGQVDGDFGITRLHSDGSTDTSFNSGAVKVIDFGGTDDFPTSVTIRGDNAIIVGGDSNAPSTHYDMAVAVIESDGSLDTGFSGDGLFTIDVSGSNTADSLDKVILLDNGHITLVGDADISALNQVAIVQLFEDGTLNTSFGTSGIASVAGAANVMVEGAILDSQGYIYAVGWGLNGATHDIMIARINPSTGIDTSFAAAETYAPLYYMSSLNTEDEKAFDIAFLNGSSGKETSLLVLGSMHDGSQQDIIVHQFNVNYDTANSEYDVTLDTSFNATGGLQIDVNSGSDDQGYRIVPDQRGNYYLIGETNNNPAILRISPNGTLDTGYGTSGIKTVSLSSGVAGAEMTGTLDANGQLLILATEDAGSDGHISVAYEYILDPPEFGSCDYAGTFESIAKKTTDNVTDAVQSSDSSYFVGGWSLSLDDGHKDFVALKSQRDGQFDPHWGNDGFVRIDAGVSVTTHEIVSLNNNELVLTGTVSTGDLIMAKLNSDGQLDTGFDSDGIRDLTGSVDLTPKQALHLSASNKFLLLGKDGTNFKSWVYRYNADGTNDNSFGAGALTSVSDVTVNYTEIQNGNFSAYDIVELSSGDLYVVGSLFDGGYQKVAVLKMSSQGLIDLTFGSSGIATVDQGSTYLGVAAVTDGNNIFVLGKENATNVANVYKFNASGLLDDGFGVNGITELSGYEISTTSDSSIQLDSMGLIWAQVRSGASTEAMVRLDSGGILDPTFVNGGAVELSHGVSGWSSVQGFLLDSTDKAILFGYDNNDFALAQMDSIGLINNFHPLTLFDFGEGEHASAMALDLYSSPILAGYSYNNTSDEDDMAIAVFDNSGNPSTTFGSLASGAIETYQFSPTDESTQFHGLDIASNGAYLAVAETFLPPSGDSNFYNFKTYSGTSTEDTDPYNPSSIDISAGNSVDVMGGQYLANDGSLYVVGSTDGAGLVIRFDEGGGFDTVFNSTGSIELSSYSDSHLEAVVPTSDGKFIAVGHYLSTSHREGILVKFFADGILDSSFGSGGIQTYDVAATDERFFDVAIGADGTIYAVGESNNDLLIAAYNNSGTLDSSFDTDGILLTDLESGAHDVATAIKVDQYGALVVLAMVENGFTLLRYQPNGTLISDFGGIRGYSPINSMRDLEIDSLGNVFVTGSTQPDQQWQFFVLRFPKAVGPY
ncbi:MAG: Ig-like domain-containing protein [Aestuariibacter sp.]